ncbi:MAG TPA: NifB/NifX family molybdenum-iron cluster-binding protein [Methanomicrobiales archaeon]|nr:NifB/NifX family molybdenum-iron cluster-binding protein [Methanomicrobiales archaeon]
MIIAIAKDGNRVSEHFGHCESYALYRIDNEIIFKAGDLKSPGHEPGRLPAFLAEQNITHVIAGGMGPKAIQLFENYGIQVILGISGNVDRVAQDFIAGRILPGESSCHHEGCNDHEEAKE